MTTPDVATAERADTASERGLLLFVLLIVLAGTAGMILMMS